MYQKLEQKPLKNHIFGNKDDYYIRNANSNKDIDNIIMHR